MTELAALEGQVAQLALVAGPALEAAAAVIRTTYHPTDLPTLERVLASGWDALLDHLPELAPMTPADLVACARDLRAGNPAEFLIELLAFAAVGRASAPPSL